MSLEKIVQYINADCAVFRSAHRQYMKNGKASPAAFNQIQGGISVDWCMFNTIEDSVLRRRKPGENWILHLSVRDIRDIDNASLYHNPTAENYGHCDIELSDDELAWTELMEKLADKSTPVLSPINP